MAIIYYPKGAQLGYRDSFNPLYEQLTIATNPNTVFYFDSASSAQGVSASGLFITCSWAQTASVTILFASNSYSASYADSASRANTASFALNAGVGATVAYTTLTTSSTNWITCSFIDIKEYINLTIGQAYNFTCSNPPTTGFYSNVVLYISNTATTQTCSLSFPTNWVFIGLQPTYLTSSKNAYLSVESFGGPIVATWGSQY